MVIFVKTRAVLIMQFRSICAVSISIISAATLLPSAASAQLIPEPWVTVGSKEGTVSYGAGVKIFDIGAEIGTGAKSKTGVDLLKFISLPFASPYAGLGLYGSDVAYSGGVHFNPSGNTFFGVGYHSVRGINGQFGIKF
jgi:hypothetical protein